MCERRAVMRDWHSCSALPWLLPHKFLSLQPHTHDTAPSYPLYNRRTSELKTRKWARETTFLYVA
jgi:hypothetical protein